MENRNKPVDWKESGFFLKLNRQLDEVKPIRKCVTCIITNDDRSSILVLEHKKCKGKFSLPAGTVEADEVENTRLTAIREMEEELCIYIDPDDLTIIEKNMPAYYDRIDGHRIYLEDVYYVEDFAGYITNNEPLKHPNLIWIPLDIAFNNPELFTYQTWRIICKLKNMDGDEWEY